MKLKARLIVWTMLLYHMRYFSPSLGTVDDLPWENADRLINAVCPNTQICELVDGKDSIQNTCCEACACRENPFVQAQCFLNTTEEYETCMYPITKTYNKYMETSKRLLLDSYPIVIKKPINGCLDARTSSCNADNISTFAPVFSAETNKTYYNSICARCHGIKTFEMWNGVLVCDDFINGSTIDFDKELQTFLENPASSLCFVQFMLQRRFRKCTLHTGQSLESLFHDVIVKIDNITEELLYGMSAKDIAGACMSSFYAPVFDEFRQKWYPNAFCYVYANKREQEVRCQMSSASAHIDYMTLLNHDAISNLQGRQKEIPKLNRVCLEKQNLNKNSEVCRPLNCPLGRLLDNNKACSFIGSRLHMKGFIRYSIHILIHSTNNSHDDKPRLVDLPVSNITDAMQLPDDMELLFVANKTDDLGKVQNQNNELLIGFFFVNMETGLEFVKQNLNAKILLNDGISSNYFTLKLFPLSIDLTGVQRKEFTDHFFSLLCPKVNWKSNDIQLKNPDHLASSCWQMRVYNIVALESITISKLYVCNLVQLMPGEFDLFRHDSLLYNKITQAYLFEKEFVAWENENGEKVAKVCLEDSGFGFGKMNNWASKNFKGYSFVAIIYFIKSIC